MNKLGNFINIYIIIVFNCLITVHKFFYLQEIIQFTDLQNYKKD